MNLAATSLKKYYTNYFLLLDALLKNKSVDSDLTRLSGKRLIIKPAKTLSFPARDVQEVVEGEDSVQLVCLFMGMYGVDSPLPMYLNSHCVADDRLGQSLRNVLDVFNHRSYVLYYQAWRALQPEHSSDYNKITHQISEGFSNSCCVGACNRSKITNVIRYYFPNIAVDIVPFQLSWVSIRPLIALGGALSLGEQTVLGDKVCDSGAQVLIILGPITSQEALKLLPEHPLGKIIIKSVQAQLPPTVSFKMQLKVKPKQTTLCLGTSDLHLGQQTWLGCFTGEFYVIEAGL